MNKNTWDTFEDVPAGAVFYERNDPRMVYIKISDTQFLFNAVPGELKGDVTYGWVASKQTPHPPFVNAVTTVKPW